MEVPVFYRCDNPKELKDKKIGRVKTYNKYTHEATFEIDDEYSDLFYGFVTNDCPISVSCRTEPCIAKDKEA